MMSEALVLIAQTTTTAGIAAWLATGVYDNIRYPENNETFTAQVMTLARMREDYPEEYARIAHRAINNRTVQRAAFRLVVVAELIATVVLMAGVVALLQALVGTGSVETARNIALLGTILFTAIWTGFLVVGNYFSYWFCHEGAQNTHYQMTLWGMATMILLVVG